MGVPETHRTPEHPSHHLATKLLNIQDPIADCWNSAPNIPLHLQQALMDTKWPHRFKIIRTPVLFKKQKEPEDPHKDEKCTNKDNSIDLHKLRSINIPGTTGKKKPEPAADLMTAVALTNFPTLPPIKLSRFWELSRQFKKHHRLFPQALADAIQSETKTLRDTGINVDSSMSWAGDRHLTNILAKWVHTERFSSSPNCNFTFRQSFSAREQDSDFGLNFDSLDHRDNKGNITGPRSFADTTGYCNPVEYTDDISQGPALTKDPAQHRLIIHTRSNTLPTNTRLHKPNPATFPTDRCPLCTHDTDTPAHALWECQKHTERLDTLATTLATKHLNIQDPIADSWNTAPNTPLHLQQSLMNTKMAK